MRALELKASLLPMASRVFPRVLTLPRQLGVPNSDLPWDPGHSALSLLSWEAGAFGQGHPPVDAGNPALENRSSISSGCSAPSSPPKLALSWGHAWEDCLLFSREFKMPLPLGPAAHPVLPWAGIHGQPEKPVLHPRGGNGRAGPTRQGPGWVFCDGSVPRQGQS